MDYTSFFKNILEFSKEPSFFSEDESKIAEFVSKLDLTQIEVVLFESTKFAKDLDTYHSIRFFYELGMSLSRDNTLYKKYGPMTEGTANRVFQTSQLFSDIFKFNLEEYFGPEMELGRALILKIINHDRRDRAVELESLVKTVSEKERRLMKEKGYVKFQEGWIKYK